MKKRGRKFQFNLNLSNRALYTLILIGILIVGAWIVYAVAPNPGHDASQIAPPAGCTNGQVLSWNTTSGVWNCASVAGSGGEEYYDIVDTVQSSAGAVRVKVWQKTISVQGGNYSIHVVANVGGTSLGAYWFGVDGTDLGYGRIRYGASEAARDQQFNLARVVALSSGSHTIWLDATSEQGGSTSYIWEKYITLIKVQ